MMGFKMFSDDEIKRVFETLEISSENERSAFRKLNPKETKNEDLIKYMRITTVSSVN